MSRLPARLQPLWPVLKRGHRFLSLLLGLVFRRLSPLLGERGVPRGATVRSAETAEREPGFVVLHPGGGEESWSRRATPGDPAGHWRFAQARTAVVPARYTLELAGGRLVGEVGASVSAGGLLDYQTSGYFGIASWREHPIFLSPTLGRVEHVPGTVLSLTARGAASNYYHFLYDAIGRFGGFEEAMEGERVDAVVVPHRTRYQRQLLELARIPGPYLEPAPGLTYRADRLLVPSTPNQDLDAPPWVVAWLRDRLPPTPGSVGDGPRRLYLSRGATPNTRRYVQEPELLAHLERRGFTVLDAGSFSVQEQIDLFHGAEVVVAPHGAALTNITFARPGLKVLEMFASTYVHLGLWTIAEAIGDVDYRYLVSDGDHRPGRPMNGPLDDVSIPVERVVAAIDAMLGDG